ncbi:MAG TPA: tRNA (guanosine(46)-N7)-methyltransferase TrmB, partial [Steroidobacteraceae bacterium]|nr:tRNA (guanosine(46)-N7)-methyltransferase TrmB [Steroidobacteraceae bacterium]
MERDTAPPETGADEPAARRHRAIRSFVVRGGRMTIAQERAWRELWPTLGLESVDGVPDWSLVFGREAPRTLEIGFGNGESLVALAGAHPERDYLGVEVHRP